MMVYSYGGGSDHARVQGSLPGGGGSRPNWQKTALTTFFFRFLVLNLVYTFTEGVQWLFQRKLLFSKVSEGVQLYPGGGGVQLNQRGVQMLISIKKPILIVIFQGGSGPPTPPPPT